MSDRPTGGSERTSGGTARGDGLTGTPCIAVLDIGKTNKKVHIYDSDLTLVESKSRNFDSVEWNGIPTIPSQAIEEWLLDTLSALASRHAIRAISVTTHGATFACVDSNGDLAVPVVDYTYEPGEEFHASFYSTVGDRDALQRDTATLELKALINPAKGIAFLSSRFPDEFARVESILFYPQYLGFRLTGAKSADYTYAGCHTYLFDFARKQYSYVADRLGVTDLLVAPIRFPGDILGRIHPDVAGRTGLSPNTLVTVGIHDSNASLLPYLIQKTGEDLIVNSTGTWCVAMHPEGHVSFTEEEIGKAVFYNMSALGEPVKTSILMGGLEFETYTTILRERAGLAGYPPFRVELYRDIVAKAREFILPAVVEGTGQYPDSVARIVEPTGETLLSNLLTGDASPGLLDDPERFYAVLNLSLAVQTVTALRRVGLARGTTVYTEGGFRGNRDYNALLSALIPDARFVLSGMPEATSFGAALIGIAALEGAEVGHLASRFTLTEEEVRRPEIPGIQAYADAFEAHLA